MAWKPEDEGWISVEERLPDIWQEVEVLGTSRMWQDSDWGKNWSYVTPTHWRPKRESK